jgi:hypothetical protein
MSTNDQSTFAKATFVIAMLALVIATVALLKT